MFSYTPFEIKFNSETFEVVVFDSPSRADDRQKECWLVSSSNEGWVVSCCGENSCPSSSRGSFGTSWATLRNGC